MCSSDLPTYKPEGTHVTLFVPNAVRWLGNVLREAAAATPGPVRRLYLSRRGTDWRRLSNEDELEDVLRQRGFETVTPERLSIAEQVRLFADAEAIVAPHGSALTNAVFARHCTVIELVNPAYPSAIFYTLSDALGHDYWYVLGDRGRDAASLDFTCSPYLVERTLDAALSR